MRITLIGAAALAAVFVSAGCAQVEQAKATFLAVAHSYCAAGEVERQALRQQFATAKGSVIQVNCENL